MGIIYLQASARLDLTIRTNVASAFLLQIVGDDDVTPFDDYTGSTFQLDALENASGSDSSPVDTPVVSLTSSAGISHTNLAIAKITIQFDPGITAGVYVYDLLRIRSGYDPELVCSGTLTVEQGVTLPA